MILTLASIALAASACVAPVTPAAADSVRAPARAAIEYESLFREGKTFAEFLDAAKARREMWLSNYKDAAVPDALLTRALAVPGPWKILVVAVDGCSDSVNTIPYIAKLAKQLPQVELRIINSTVGKEVMEAHRTPDGRAATPTIVLLDSTFVEKGCFIERPPELQARMAEQKEKQSGDAAFEGKMKWYEGDKGQSTIQQIVVLLEEAAAGRPVCK